MLHKGHTAMGMYISVVSLFFCCVIGTNVPIHEYEVPCYPEQVHIAFGDSVSEMVILWSTMEPCTSELLFGTDPWAINTNVTGDTIMFKELNDKGLHFIHRVKLQSLHPKTTYFYRPVSKGISSGPFYFRTPPAGQDWMTDFMVYGDLGLQSDSVPYLNTEILSGQYTAVLHVGDFAYQLRDKDGLSASNDTSNNETLATATCFKEVGDQYMRLLEDISGRIPYMTSPGNHEIDEETFAHYRHRFSMPKSPWPMPLNKMWYSIDIGPVHVVSYSTEVFFTNQGAYVMDQKNWLMADLKQANDNRQKVPWVIAFGHRPMYCSNTDGDDCTTDSSKVRKGLEDIFFNYGVDIVIQAHEHSYERLYPVYKGVVTSKNYSNPQAPVQLISGASGSKYKIDKQKRSAIADWSAFRMDNGSLNSFGRLKVQNETHIFWEQVSVKTQQVLDAIWITQDDHGPFVKSKLNKEVSKKIEIKTKEEEKAAKPTTHGAGVQTGSAAGGGVQVDTSPDRTSDGGKSQSFFESRNVHIAIGTGGGVLLLIFIITFIVFRQQRKKSQKYRRWDQTVDYGRKFYSAGGYAHIQNNEKDNEDFEVEITDGNLPTSKLLTE